MTDVLTFKKRGGDRSRDMKATGWRQKPKGSHKLKNTRDLQEPQKLRRSNREFSPRAFRKG